MLAGDNGILMRTTDAKEKSDIAQIQEEIQLAWIGVQVDGITKGWDNSTKAGALNTELEKEGGTATWNDTNSVIDVTYKGYTTTINPNTGAVTALAKAGENPVTPNPPSSTVVKIGTTDIISITGFDDSEGLKDYYGETTDFKSADTGDLATINWQLFYDDTDNIYLISSDYIPTSQLPCYGNSGFGNGDLYPNEGNTGNQNYKAGFCTSNSYDDYVMSNSSYTAGANASSITNNTLTSKYLKWVVYAKSKSYSLTNSNMVATAFMMDTNKWNIFAGELAESGAFAIGGPTIEMFVQSYNAYSEHSSKCGTYEDLNTQNTNQTGYKVKVPGNTSWSTSTQGGLDKSKDNMWVKTSKDKANGMWLASPSSNGDKYMRFIDSSGYLNDSWVKNCSSLGFRPLVIVPKCIL